MEPTPAFDRKKIIDQIHKMSELANPDNGAFPGEIAAASALMQKLMDKYAVTMDEVNASHNDEVEKAVKAAWDTCQVDAIVFGKILPWNWELARLIGRITHTKHYSSTSWNMDRKTKTLKGDVHTGSVKIMCFYGKGDSPAIARDLFIEWAIKINVMASQATGEYSRKYAEEWNLDHPEEQVKTAYQLHNLGSDHPNIFKSSWLKGCLDAMRSALYAQEQSRTAEMSSALVVYNEDLASMWNQFSHGFRNISINHNNHYNGAGYKSGEAAGKTLHIGQKAIHSKSHLLSD
jgi:hypothetical protein